MNDRSGSFARRFTDRRDSGRCLAARLAFLADAGSGVVLGMARGGVVCAAEVARELRLPLDVLLACKLGAPGNPELAIGALAEGGEPLLNSESVALTGASDAWIVRETERARAEIARRQTLYRGGRALALPRRSTVVLVDDGVATGATVSAALDGLRRQDIEYLVVAVPVAPPETAEILRGQADQLVALSTPAMFGAVGASYESFGQVSDEEVRELLARAEAEGRRLSVRPTAPAPRIG